MTSHRATVSLRDFVDADRVRLVDWARRIGSADYMARYTPHLEACLLWSVIQADGNDIGTVWLEHLPEPGEANIGILIGEPSFFGQGIGKLAINLAISKARDTVALHVIRLHVRESNARAIACYERCGFHVINSFMRETQGKSYTVLSMQRLL